jgi:sugar lactone lactonase YvrE
MIVADAMKGLLAIPPDARVTVLTDRVSDTDPIRYANSIVVAPDGVILFTDASGRFAPREWGGTYEASVLDILEQAATGRVLAYDPVTSSTQVVAHGFSFANGIALSADGQSLFISETGRYRIWKIDRRARDLDVRAGSPRAQPLLDPYGHVFAFDEAGRVTEDWQDPSGAYPETTGATETRDRIYIHSLNAPTIGWVPR